MSLSLLLNLSRCMPCRRGEWRWPGSRLRTPPKPQHLRRCPSMRQKLLDPADRVQRQALQHIAQITIPVLPVDACRVQKAHDSRNLFSGAKVAGEKPVRSAKRNRSDPGSLQAANRGGRDLDAHAGGLGVARSLLVAAVTFRKMAASDLGSGHGRLLQRTARCRRGKVP